VDSASGKKEGIVDFSRPPGTLKRLIVAALIAAMVVMTWAGSPGTRVALAASDPAVFPLGLNPGLAAGKPFACPAIQGATASISVTNRFVEDTQNDVMTLTASGLPPNTGFDVFIVQNSPLDAGFSGFGFAWYQSDMESDGSGHATVVMQGIFDKETFIEDPGNPTSPVHTFNVGFWFDSPTTEQYVCGNAAAPAATPFNGEQNAGLLAMITTGGPLQQITDAPPPYGGNSPKKGSVRVGNAQTFVTTCSHPNGWKNIHTIDFRLTKGKYKGHIKALALWVQLDQNANLVRFYDPATKKWTQGTPGSNKTLSGKWASLSLAHTVVHGFGPTDPKVSVTWQFTFKSPAIGNGYKQGVRVEDDFGSSMGWHNVGTLTISPPGYLAAHLQLHASPASVAGRPAQAGCSTASCTFTLGVNPGLLPGKPFACPAIQNAHATITVTNRFVTNEQNDTMTLSAGGLPPGASFDVFLVQNSPLDAGFSGFGFGWYQSDMESDASGNASITVKGIFDHEVFIDNPASPTSPIHTFNVGFWFSSPTSEQQVCGNATAPAATPFNGEQNAGLLAMVTTGGPLNNI
jgi:hypothetical protein